MELLGSTSTGHPGTGAIRLRRLAVRILCTRRRRLPPEKLAALLLPMVRRAVRTKGGPAALLSWLRQCPDVPPVGPPSERASRALTAELVRLLFDQPDSPAETLGDPR